MRWFRLGRKAQVEHAPVEAAAPVELPNPVTVEAAPGAAETDQSSKPKRRRGSRGGRGRARAKPGEPAATAKPRDEKDKEKKDRKPERKPAQQSQRRERAQSQRRRREPPKPRPLPAAKRELLISVDVGEQRVAVVEDDKVAEVYLERPERRSIAGNIYLGTVDNVLPG
ncbi:MAG: hypothetical protein JF623_05190, partial [Acidobacteria bacterium]|nr:hypothetical protein [Acidobacteriota bacterium]